MANFSSNESYENDKRNILQGVIQTSIGLTPLALSSAYVFNKIKANKAIAGTVTGGSTGGVHRVLKQAGSIVQTKVKTGKAARAEAANTMAEKIMEDDYLNQMFATVGKQNAVLMSLSDFLSDPDSNLDQAKLMSYRQEISDLMNKGLDADPDKFKEVIRSVVRAVNETGSPEAAIRWENNLRQYRDVGDELTPPRTAIEPTLPFTHASPTNRSTAGRRLSRLQKSLEFDQNYRIEAVTINRGGVEQSYGRIMYGEKNQWIANVPLDLGNPNSPSVPFFMGENFNTGYTSPRYHLDGSTVADMLEKGKAGSLSDLRKGGKGQRPALRDIEDHVASDFLYRAKKAHKEGRRMSGQAYNAELRDLMEGMPRVVSDNMEGMGQFPGHLKANSSFHRNSMLVTNIPGKTQEEMTDFMLKLVNIKGIDPHTPGRVLTSKVGGRTVGWMGLNKDSVLSNMRPIGPTSRKKFPVVSRIEQMAGKGYMFMRQRGEAARTMGRSGTLSAGAVMADTAAGVIKTGKNIRLGEGLSGGSNKAFLINLNEASEFYKQTEGSGVAYHKGQETFMEAFTKPILDSGKHGTSSTRLQDEIMKRTKGVAGATAYFTAEEINEFGGVLGIGTGGVQVMKNDPDMVGAYLGYQVHDAHGRRQTHISGSVVRQQGNVKVFSAIHKGFLQVVDDQIFNRILTEDFGLDGNFVKGAGIDERDLVFTSGDYLKKAQGAVEMQMAGGYGVFTTNKKWEDDLHKSFKGLAGDNDSLERSTQAVINRMVAENFDPKEAGMVLAATRKLGKNFSLSQERLDEMINTSFGDVRGKQVIESAKRGIAVGGATTYRSTGLGDYGRGRGSIERRQLVMWDNRLQAMGISEANRATFLSDLIKRKVNIEHDIPVARGLMSMAESVHGQGSGIIDTINNAKSNVRVVTLAEMDDLSRTLQANPQAFNDLMRANPEGLILDLTSGLQNGADREIAAAAQAAFGHGQIKIPGKEVWDSIQEAIIKDLEGGKSVDSAYSGMIKGFVQKVAELRTMSTDVGTKSDEAFVSFRKGVTGLFSEALYNISAGKLKGSASSPVLMYAGRGLSVENAGLVRDITKRSHGRAVFQSWEHFTRTVHDYVGDGHPSNNKIKDAARQLESFFMTSNEIAQVGKASRRTGVLQAMARAPALSFGNVPMVEVFRHVEELGDGMDAPLKRFLATKHGSENWGNGKVKSWDDVRRMPTKLRWAFFKDMAREIGKVAPEAGGAIYLPNQKHTVYGQFSGGKTSLEVDFGISSAAIGDWDGDHWLSIMLNNEAGKTIRSTLSSQAGTRYTQAENLYKVYTDVFISEAKEGLKKHSIDTSDWDQRGILKIQQDLLKENAVNLETGKLDIKLNMLRVAAVAGSNAGQDDAIKSSKILGLLKVLQEHTIIKSKKVEVYTPFAEWLGNAIDQTIENGDFTEFRRIMKEEVFHNTEFASKQGVKIQSIDREGLGYMPDGKDEILQLDEILDNLEEALKSTKGSDMNWQASANRLNMALEGATAQEKEAIFTKLHAGEGIEGSIMHAGNLHNVKAAQAYASGIFGSAADLLNHLDGKMLGVMAAGLFTSSLVMGLVMAGGHSPRPLTAPGEYIPPELRDKIATQSLIGHVDPQVNPEGLMQESGSRFDKNTPINTGMTYASQPTSYQLRGNISNASNIMGLNNYMGQITSGRMTGSLLVNDTRRPITANYIDRLIGED